MTILGGTAALSAIWLMLAWTTLLSSQLASPEPPHISGQQALHAGVVEVDWNNVAGADRYELQFQREQQWIGARDSAETPDAIQLGSRALIRGISADSQIDALRVRAGHCRGWSRWSEPADLIDTHAIDWDRIPRPEIERPTGPDSESASLWSAMLEVEASADPPGSIGFALTRGFGAASSIETASLDGRVAVLAALQKGSGFQLDLFGRDPLPDELWLTITDLDRDEIIRLSTCDAFRHDTAAGARFVWPNAREVWRDGDLVEVSLGRGGLTESRETETSLRSNLAFTARFEEMPQEHSNERFSFQLSFSEPIALNADQLGTHALRVTSGYVASVEQVDGRADLWSVAIQPDGRSSVHIRLTGTQRCIDSYALCTQHLIPLSNQPAATVSGPPITVDFLRAPDYHSGLDRIPVRIAFSEPIFVNPRTLADLGLRTEAGSLEPVRRIDGRHDLWEAVLIPESSDDLVLRVESASGCPTDHSGCLELQRIDGSPTLRIPPATIYLTFDDGPDPFNTPIILDILLQHDARATFFVVGRSVVSFPELIDRMVSEGHTLANHTWAHDDLLRLSDEEVKRTLLRTQEALGEHATDCFRPPNYRFDDRTVQLAASLGLRMVLNTGATEDWRLPGAAAITANILASASPDVILVLHDGGGVRSQTSEGLRAAMNILSKQRFAFEPICR